jgi:hypothetical protein
VRRFGRDIRVGRYVRGLYHVLERGFKGRIGASTGEGVRRALKA